MCIRDRNSNFNIPILTLQELALTAGEIPSTYYADGGFFRKIGTGAAAADGDGFYTVVNSTGCLFLRDKTGPVNVSVYTSGTDAERLVAAAKVARIYGDRTVCVGDRVYDLSGYTEEIHNVNFIGEGSFINGPDRVRVFLSLIHI